MSTVLEKKPASSIDASSSSAPMLDAAHAASGRFPSAPVGACVECEKKARTAGSRPAAAASSCDKASSSDSSGELVENEDPELCRAAAQAFKLFYVDKADKKLAAMCGGLVPGNHSREEGTRWDDQHVRFILHMQLEKKSGTFGKKSSEELQAAILGSLAFPDQTERACANFMQSGAIADKSQSVIELSRENLARLAEARAQHPPDEQLEAVIAAVSALYEAPVFCHATARSARGFLYSTTLVTQMMTFAAKFGKSDIGEKQKASNTSLVNTAQFQTHDFVFLNVYPAFADETAKKKTLGATRFLRADYFGDPRTAPPAPGAKSFTFSRQHLGNMIVLLRDPACPSGGKDEAEARKRINKPPPSSEVPAAASASSSSLPAGKPSDNEGRFIRHLRGAGGGEYAYTVGTKGREHVYRSREHVFYGEDVPQALVLNVAKGLYELKDGFAPEEWEKYKGELPMDKPAELIKYFQYPQALVPGSVVLPDKDKDAAEYGRRVIDWDREDLAALGMPPRPAAASSASSVAAPTLRTKAVATPSKHKKR